MAVRSLKNSTIENFANYSSSMNAGYDFNDFELIESVFVASNTGSVTFNNLNQYATEYKHLQIRIAFRATSSSTFGQIKFRYNNDSTTSYVHHELWGQNGGVNSFAALNQTSNGLVWGTGANAASNNFGSGIVDILDAFSGSKNKTTRALSGMIDSGGHIVMFSSGLYNKTDAISSINLFPDSGSFLTGSRFSLYGIR